MDTTQVRKTTKSAGGQRKKAGPAESTGVQEGPVTTRTVLAAVNDTERLICGPFAVRSPARAEGAALVGRRAANLLDSARLTDPDLEPGPLTGRPWVFHRFGGGRPPARGKAIFELVAASAQTAVDNCLIAHGLAEQTGHPAVCTLDPRLACRLDMVRLPDQDQVQQILGSTNAEAAWSRPGVWCERDMLQAASAVLARVAAATGRTCAPFTTFAMEGARHIVVAGSARFEMASRVAECLREAGVPAGVVSPRLIRPFPTADLASLLSEATAVVTVGLDSVDAEENDLTTHVADAVARLDRPIPIGAGDPADGTTDRFAALVGAVVDLVPAKERPKGLFETIAAPEVAGVSLVAVPEAEWSMDLLLALSAHLAGLGPIHLDLFADGVSGRMGVVVSRGRAGHSPPPPEYHDVLIVAEPALFDPKGPSSRIRDGGTVVMCGDGSRHADPWWRLNAAQRGLITARHLQFWWLDVGAAGTDGASLTARLQGAVLKAAGSLADVVDCDTDLTAAVVERLQKSTGSDDVLVAGLQEGAARVRLVELPPPSATPPREESGFRRREYTLQVPAPAEESAPDAGDIARRFHVTGEGPLLAPEPPPGIPLRPAVLAAWRKPGAGAGPYPLFLPAAETGRRTAIPFAELLNQALETATEAESLDALRDHLWRLARHAGRLVGGSEEPASVSDVFARAAEVFVAEFEARDQGRQALREMLDRLARALPAKGVLLGLSRPTLLQLYTASLAEQCHSVRRQFVAEVEKLVGQLKDHLRIDRLAAPESATPEALGEGMGKEAGAHIEFSTLSRALPRRRGSKRLDPERRRRMEEAAAVLGGFLTEAAGADEFYLVHAHHLPGGPLSAPGAETMLHPDPYAAAIGIYDGLVDAMLPVFRAVRLARLDVTGRYVPDAHDKRIALMDRHTLSGEELASVPPVVVLDTEANLRGTSLASFSELLQCGRAIQVLVMHPSTAHAVEVTEGFCSGLSYRSIAHREALVLQSTLANPGHLVAGLARMVQARRPAVAFVGVPDPAVDHDLAWLQVRAAHEGRAMPCFLYDPDAGPSWATRFDLSANPQPERAWPLYSLPVADAEGARAEKSFALTFAEVMTLVAGCRKHFRVLPSSAWSDNQVELSDYLAAMQNGLPDTIPYLWLVDEDGLLQRAVITRELAAACLDRARFWRTLQELAGLNNEHVRLAAEAAHAAAEKAFDAVRRQMEADHAATLKAAGEQAAGEVIDRLVGALMSTDTIPVALPSVPAPPAPPPAAPAATANSADAPPRPAPAEEKEEDVSFDEPYIDIARCTTCNECTNLNPLLFKYNENKQAYIADAAAGTFQQLVLAAEKCPARCIFPGAPREGDATATEEMRARASTFR